MIRPWERETTMRTASGAALTTARTVSGRYRHRTMGRERLAIVLGLAMALGACAGPSTTGGRGSQGIIQNIEAPLTGANPKLRLSRSQVRGLADATHMAVTGPVPLFETTWVSASGLEGVVEAGPPFLGGFEDEDGNLVILPEGLKIDVPIEPMGIRGKPNANTNVRNGPGTDYDVVQTVPKGTVIQLLGTAAKTEWVLIAKDAKALGYMFGPLIDADQSEADGGKPEVAVPVVDLETGESPQKTYTENELDVLLAGGEPRPPTLCRHVRHRVTDRKGRLYEWPATACRIGPSHWRIMGSGVEKS